MSDTNEDQLFIISVLIRASRYADAIACFDQFVAAKPSLTRYHCKLFEDAFKKAIDPMRKTLRQLMSFYDAEVDDGHALRAEMIQIHKEKTHSELKALCEKAISIIKVCLVPTSQSPQTTVFLYRSLGDYYRYLTEFDSGPELRRVSTEAEANYQAAVQFADAHLLKSDAARLNAILHWAIFKYDHLKSVTEAFELLQKARIDAEIDLPELDVTGRSESLLALENMQANLVVWFADEDKN
jgi:14-3-3 protein epsilon